MSSLESERSADTETAAGKGGTNSSLSSPHTLTHSHKHHESSVNLFRSWFYPIKPVFGVNFPIPVSVAADHCLAGSSSSGAILDAYSRRLVGGHQPGDRFGPADPPRCQRFKCCCSLFSLTRFRIQQKPLVQQMNPLSLESGQALSRLLSDDGETP